MYLPEPLLAHTKELFQAGFNDFLSAMQSPLPVSVRVNDKLPLSPSDEKVAWCDSGYYLDERPLFTADPLFHAGAYYVQEASSMFLQQALQHYVPSDGVVLDLCAAPGGKSTLISQFLDKSGFLVSNEIIRSRAYILTENIIKWGNDNVLSSNNAPAAFRSLPSFFDAVVVDAPCSGEGMFRKSPESVAQWSLENVRMCAARQRNILSEVWDTLKTGGVLIYSTCTYNRDENERNVEWIINELGAEPLRLNTEMFPEITISENGYRFYPHKTRGEGFFLSVLRKTSASPTAKSGKKTKPDKSRTLPSAEDLRQYLTDPFAWDISSTNNRISAIKKIHAEKVEILKKELNTIHTGVTLAEQKGRGFVPNISLALSKNIDTGAIETAEVEITDALRYLKKETIYLSDADKGHILLTYRSLPVGWVKNVGNRCNNLYPSEWMIRMKIDTSV